MKSYDELKKEFNKKVEELQKKCPHSETAWAEEWWAIAHSTGYAVKYCKFCHKQLKKIPLKEAYKRGYLRER